MQCYCIYYAFCIFSYSLSVPLLMNRHERYLGMWSDGVKSGPGMFVTSTGSYGEAIFSAGNIAVRRLETTCTCTRMRLL